MSVENMLYRFIALFGFIATTLGQTSSDPGKSSSAPSQTSSEAPSCNYSLLNTLKLTGKKPKDPLREMSICGLPQNDNCCSEIDEIKIIKMWNTFSLPQINHFRQGIVNSFESICDLYPFFGTIALNKTSFHSQKISWVKRKETKCYTSSYFKRYAKLDIGDSKGDEETILDDLVTKVADLMFAQNQILATKEQLVKLLGGVFKGDFGGALVNWLGSDNCIPFASQIIKKVSDKLSSGEIISITPLPGSTVETLIEQKYSLKGILEPLCKSLSAEYLSDVVLNKAVRFSSSGLSEIFTKAIEETLASPELKPLITEEDQKNLIKEFEQSINNDPSFGMILGPCLIPSSAEKAKKCNEKLIQHLFSFLFELASSSLNLKEASPHSFMSELVVKIMKSKDLISTSISSSFCKIATSVVAKLHLDTGLSSIADKSLDQFMLEIKSNLTNRIFNSTSLTNPVITSTGPECEIDKNVNELLKVAVSEVATENSWALKTDTQVANGTALLTVFKDWIKQAYFSSAADSLDQKICTTKSKHVLVNKIVFNPKKYNFCKNKLKEFRKNLKWEEIGQCSKVGEVLDEMLNLRKGLYCAACSSSMSKFMSVKENSVVFSNSFCTDLVRKFGSYLKWRSTVFISLLEQVYQIASCFDSNKKEGVFPYPDLDGMIPPKIEKIDECLNAKTDAAVSACLPICSAFKLGGFSSKLEGDVSAVQRSDAYLIGVLRRYGFTHGNTTANKTDYSVFSRYIDLESAKKRKGLVFKTSKSSVSVNGLQPQDEDGELNIDESGNLVGDPNQKIKESSVFGNLDQDQFNRSNSSSSNSSNDDNNPPEDEEPKVEDNNQPKVEKPEVDDNNTPAGGGPGVEDNNPSSNDQSQSIIDYPQVVKYDNATNTNETIPPFGEVKKSVIKGRDSKDTIVLETTTLNKKSDNTTVQKLQVFFRSDGKKIKEVKVEKNATATTGHTERTTIYNATSGAVNSTTSKNVSGFSRLLKMNYNNSGEKPRKDVSIKKFGNHIVKNNNQSHFKPLHKRRKREASKSSNKPILSNHKRLKRLKSNKMRKTESKKPNQKSENRLRKSRVSNSKPIKRKRIVKKRLIQKVFGKNYEILEFKDRNRKWSNEGRRHRSVESVGRKRKHGLFNNKSNAATKKSRQSRLSPKYSSKGLNIITKRRINHRLLEEKRGFKKHRRLNSQNQISQSQNSTNTTSAGSQSAANSNVPSNPATPSSSVSPPSPCKVTNEFLMALLQKIDTLDQPTRPDFANHDEIACAKTNFVPVDISVDIRKMTSSFSDKGIDLFKINSALNFEVNQLETLFEKNLPEKSERISPEAIKDIIQINEDDPVLFSKEIDTQIDTNMPFEVFSHKPAEDSESILKSHLNPKQKPKMRKLKLTPSKLSKGLKPIKRNRRESLMSLFYKLMF